MTQKEYNIIVRAIVFASSTDCCMDSDAVDGSVDALKALLKENPELTENVDFGSVYIYNTDPTYQEDPEINAKLLEIFEGKLDNRGYEN